MSAYNTKSTNSTPVFKVNHHFFQISFFPVLVNDWSKLDHNIRNSEGLNTFKKIILNYIYSSGSSVFNCHNFKGIKLLIRLRVGLSHLHEHKFKHSFKNHLTQSAAVVKRLKHQLQMKDQPC